MDYCILHLPPNGFSCLQSSPHSNSSPSYMSLPLSGILPPDLLYTNIWIILFLLWIFKHISLWLGHYLSRLIIQAYLVLLHFNYCTLQTLHCSQIEGLCQPGIEQIVNLLQSTHHSRSHLGHSWLMGRSENTNINSLEVWFQPSLMTLKDSRLQWKK